MTYICGLDIGSSKIAACLTCFRGKELTQLWWDSTAVVGIKRGQVQDVQALTAMLSQLLKNLKEKSGVRIKSVYLGIAGQNIVVKHSQAAIALSESGSKSITKTDIQNVNQQARILCSSFTDEILHTEALSYTVDNENEVINPLGLYGHQLKVDLYLICARASYTNTITEIINRLGLKLNDITLSGLAVSQAVFNSKKTEAINILCDVGKDITQILIFKDTRLLHCQIITSGGDDLTTRLARELNLSHSLAEEVKISYGCIQNNCETPDKEIIVKKDDNYTTLSRNRVIQILTRESRRIAEAIRDVIRPHLLTTSSPLMSTKATLYVSGRTVYLDGFLELLEVVIGIPVKMAELGNSALLTPLMRYRILFGESILNYLTCLGLIAKAIKLPYNKLARPMHGFSGLLSYIPEKVREIYQEYF